MTGICDGSIAHSTSLVPAQIAAEGGPMVGVCVVCGESTDIFECPSLLDGEMRRICGPCIDNRAHPASVVVAAAIEDDSAFLELLDASTVYRGGGYMSAKAWLALGERQGGEPAQDERQELEPAPYESGDPLRSIMEKSKNVRAEIDARPVKPRRLGWHVHLARILRRAIPNSISQGNV